jgi:hypothetical protein
VGTFRYNNKTSPKILEINGKKIILRVEDIVETFVKENFKKVITSRFYQGLLSLPS